MDTEEEKVHNDEDVPKWYGFSLMDDPNNDPDDVAPIKEICTGKGEL